MYDAMDAAMTTLAIAYVAVGMALGYGLRTLIEPAAPDDTAACVTMAQHAHAVSQLASQTNGYCMESLGNAMTLLDACEAKQQTKKGK